MPIPGVTPFAISVPDEDVEDLRRRLRATRWPDPATVGDWSQGVPLEYLRELCRYWAEDYDWQGRQARLNAVEQYTTDVQGLSVHFLHAPSAHPGALPLVLTHGWPGSVAEFLAVLGPLTDPAAHGGDPRDAFTVVAPSLPGFGWSGKPTGPGWGIPRVADAWAELMSRLGHERFGAQGGDLGSFVSANLAARHPDRVVGIHLNMAIGAPPAGRTEFSEREQRANRAAERFRTVDSAYHMQQRTRPQTLAYGLADSPAAQCAWILEKFWSWSDCGGDPVAVLGADRILDHVATYWFTGSAGSSARMYWEMAQDPASRAPTVDVPTGVSLFPHEILQPTEEWARAHYRDLRMWHEHDRGGHFAAMEEPDVLVRDIRGFFRPLR
ncbi:epoxide hydrolase family protein [Blastococcus xanthinilyticus]|uniref:Pimeloyl-ACP methyl ester carboxylesterase n=1 Tax=Blastococcus xanthinilyticus TaxID=1564164 RepID=A0A5S5D4U7_9ACTN|nr:epoxide hydrolase family protein [Blastococcus xanthinilyticus]TYP90318.1 pimeloyl-ACP methyl ester carboxylesterase [Blastococcus xanthinilyticus]